MNEQEKIEILKKLRDEIDMACKCDFLSFPEKQEWVKQVEALNWAIVKLALFGRRDY